MEGRSGRWTESERRLRTMPTPPTVRRARNGTRAPHLLGQTSHARMDPTRASPGHRGNANRARRYPWCRGRNQRKETTTHTGDELNEYRKALRLLVSQAVHARKERHRQLHPHLYCGSCGAWNEDYEAGCRTCTTRRWKRMRRAELAESDTTVGTCSSCGISHDEYRPGCRRCKDRRAVRNHRERKAAA